LRCDRRNDGDSSAAELGVFGIPPNLTTLRPRTKGKIARVVVAGISPLDLGLALGLVSEAANIGSQLSILAVPRA
jgi:hypothetical protein